MPDPSERVAGHDACKNEPVICGRDSVDPECQSQTRSDVMQSSANRVAVFTEIVRIEVPERLITFFTAHAVAPAAVTGKIALSALDRNGLHQYSQDPEVAVLLGRCVVA